MTGSFAVVAGTAPPGRPAQGAAPQLPPCAPFATRLPPPTAPVLVVDAAPAPSGGARYALANGQHGRYGDPLIRAWGGPRWWLCLMHTMPSHSGVISMAADSMAECTTCGLNWEAAEA